MRVKWAQPWRQVFALLKSPIASNQFRCLANTTVYPYLHFPPPVTCVHIVVMTLIPVPLVIVSLGPKYDVRREFCTAIQCFDTFNGIVGVHRHCFSTNHNILALEVWVAR